MSIDLEQHYQSKHQQQPYVFVYVCKFGLHQTNEVSINTHYRPIIVICINQHTSNNHMYVHVTLHVHTCNIEMDCTAYHICKHSIVGVEIIITY